MKLSTFSQMSAGQKEVVFSTWWQEVSQKWIDGWMKQNPNKNPNVDPFLLIREAFLAGKREIIEEIPERLVEPNWTPIQTNQLGYVRAGGTSCIAWDQKLSTSGGIMTAKEIYDAIAAGRQVFFLTQNLDDTDKCLNPVSGAVLTRAQGRKITLVDGRSVILTDGHMVPTTEENLTDGSLAYEGKTFIVLEQGIAPAGALRPGDEIMDGVIESIEPMGKIDAVRLWTGFPAWIQTPEGLSIGTRWHEIMLAWFSYRENEYGFPCDIFARGYLPIIPSRKYSERGQEVYSRPYVFKINTTNKYIDRGSLAVHSAIRQVICNNLVFGGQDYQRQKPGVSIPENLAVLSTKEKVTASLTAGTEVVFGSAVYAAAA